MGDDAVITKQATGRVADHHIAGTRGPGPGGGGAGVGVEHLAQAEMARSPAINRNAVLGDDVA